MEALRNKPIGYKAWSEISPPITPDYFLSDIYPSSSMEKSLESAASRDALLIVISNLITENRSLKSENDWLRKKMLMQQASSSVEAEQAATFSSKQCKKPIQAHQETFNGESCLKRCKFCGTTHVWGKSRCPKFNKVLDKNSKFNFSRISSARSSADEESSDGDKKRVKGDAFQKIVLIKVLIELI